MRTAHTQQQEVKQLLEEQRKLLPKLGGKKLYYLIKDELKQNHLSFGRDKIFEVLRNNNMLIKPKKRYVQTTMSKHWLRKYPNLLKTTTATMANQVWVSDITYIKTDEGNCYLNLLTDAYSRKIVGYAIAPNMEATEMKKAFEMAVKQRDKPKQPLMHHSDRGLQYCSQEYTAIAKVNNITISMTENGDPYENALAERMNRTMKEEFGLGAILKTRQQAKILVEQAVELYNNHRPHLSLQMKTPQQVHKQKSQSLA